ncbi:hypothetical protein [Flagellimonas oceanensis]|uniref:hypothetical protein n=1 Tax=Flagellimonas oceanensis TaxID=2499163 RepID=UPI000F8F3C25|nr:hypothetical protein [Allomuricauda oceanensis]
MTRITLTLCFAALFSCQSKNKIDREQGQQDTIIETIAKEEGAFKPIYESFDYLILGKKPTDIMVIQRSKASDGFPIYNQLTSYGDDVIMGKDVNFEDLRIYKKYAPKSTFEDYAVEVYEGKLANPDFSTNPDAKSFITRIKQGCAEGVNFAGHYTLITWGCGSPCQTGVVVDRISGKIHEGLLTSLGLKFKKDSKLVIKNIGAIDPKTNLIEVCSYCEVKHEIWTGSSFEKVY